MSVHKNVTLTMPADEMIELARALNGVGKILDRIYVHDNEAQAHRALIEIAVAKISDAICKTLTGDEVERLVDQLSSITFRG